MQILCLGDIALSNHSGATWFPPASIVPGGGVRILFNWEFPVGDKVNPKPRMSGMRFIAHPDSVTTVKNWAPAVATLATNHILDAGEVGLAETINALQQAGFNTVGAGMTFDEIARPLLWTTADGTLAIINWVSAETHPDWLAIPGPNCWPGLEEAKYTIRAMKGESDWVLVVVHWSDELFPYPLPEDRKIASKLADMGADIVIGHHPHVVRGMETFGNCPVFYSLGNFYFTEKKNSTGGWILKEAPRNREGLGVRLTLRQGQKLEYELLSFWNNNVEAVPDLAHRAAKRLRSTSIALHRKHGETYVNWYKKQRDRFDKWGYRWHFGLLRRGVMGTVQRIIVKMCKSLLASQ